MQLRTSNYLSLYFRISVLASDYFALNGAQRSQQIPDVRMNPVRHRSRATYSRQPRQVRKEATVTGSCVCSEPPVPGFFHNNLPGSLHLDYRNLHGLYDSFRKNRFLVHL